MINTDKFTIRLQEILSFYELSAAAFAEKMGVGRSSISHIISGRNKPSLEFVLHILEHFDEVTFDWLMHGKGNFPKSQNASPQLFQKTEKKQPEPTIEKKRVFDTQPDLFSDTPANSNQEKRIENTVIAENSSEIERIVIFYKSGKFREYKN